MSEEEILVKLHNSLSSNTINNIMVLVTRLGDYGLIWGILLVYLYSKKETRELSIYLIKMFIKATVVCLVTKFIVHRPRPYTKINDVDLLVHELVNDSFPSCHTTQAVTMLVGLINKKSDKTLTNTVGVLAPLIALSRMYLYMHYPTDIVGGVIIGVLVNLSDNKQ